MKRYESAVHPQLTTALVHIYQRGTEWVAFHCDDPDNFPRCSCPHTLEGALLSEQQSKQAANKFIGDVTRTQLREPATPPPTITRCTCACGCRGEARGPEGSTCGFCRSCKHAKS